MPYTVRIECPVVSSTRSEAEEAMQQALNEASRQLRIQAVNSSYESGKRKYNEAADIIDCCIIG